MSCWLSGLGALGRDRPVNLYDQLGSGRSKAPADTTRGRLERFVDELDAVRSALHLKQTHLYGSSWGGTIVLEYLLTRHPRGVGSVIFASPLISTPRWMADARRLMSTLPDSVQTTLEQHEADGTTDAPECKAAMRVYAK
jgi:proline iminopeptidase